MSFFNSVKDILRKCGLLIQQQILDKKNKSRQINKEKKPHIRSTLGIKYPALRDHPSKSAECWLKGKRIDDDIGDSWRIHNGLYDFSSFIKLHPGGAFWLECSRGTDITEVFESYHITTTAENLISKYWIGDANKPRASPFTFEENGFYRTLKKNARPLLKTLPKNEANKSKFYADLVCFLIFAFAISTVYWQSHILGNFAAVMLALNVVSAHNFIHFKDNFRMYYYDLTTMHSSNARVAHVLTHHAFPNTTQDLKILTVEPYINYFPQKKFLSGYYGWFFYPFIYLQGFVFTFVKRLILGITDNKGLNKLKWDIFIPFSIPTAMYISMYFFNRISVQNVLYWWIFMLCLGCLWMGIVIISAGHHQPENFHDGNVPRSDMDWGLYQMDTVIDRSDIAWSHFLKMTNFGDHIIHHLFPAIDCGQLPYLYPALLKTCEEFDMELRSKSYVGLIKGHFQQMVKNEPDATPPGFKKK